MPRGKRTVEPAEENLIVEPPKRRGRPPKIVTPDAPAAETSEDEDPEEVKKIVRVTQMRFANISVVFEGISPLICNSPLGKFGRTGEPDGRPKHEKYNMDEEFKASLYPMVKNEKGEMRYSIPARWFRKAIIYTIPLLGWGKLLTTKMGKGAIFVMGDQLPLIYDTKHDPQKYIALVRRPPGRPNSPTIQICRSLFEKWSVVVPIRYNTAILTVEQVVNICQLTGTVSGFGEDRPERAGTHGMAQVKGAPSGLIP